MPSKPQLDFVVRRNRGKLILHQWAKQLSIALGQEVLSEQFLSLVRTDRLKVEFVNRLKERHGVERQNWPIDSLPQLANKLRDLCSHVRLTPVVLFSAVDSYVGAVQMSASPALLNFPAIWKVVEDDFRIATPDLQSGLCVERNYYDIGGTYVKNGALETATWGVFCIKNPASVAK
jgi:hypothetical protein